MVTKLATSDPHLTQRLNDAGVPCVGVSPEVLGGLAQPGAEQPAVLAIDLRGARQFPPELALLKRRHPNTAVLLIVSDLDPALILEAMRAGVNECVTDPLDPSEVQAAIKRLMRNVVAAPRGDVFAFIGAKGGVGATTIAVNVATALAKATREPTLLVDLNAASGDAAVFLGEEPRFSVVDALENVHRLDSAYFGGLIVRTGAGLELLGAHGRPLTSSSYDAPRIRALIDFVSQARRYTVLDVPRSDAPALDALEMASKIVLVANQELATVRNASRMAATLRQRYGRDRVALVLARTDRRAEIGHEDVERTVGIEVRHTFPSDYRLALQAMNKGRPIVLDNHNDLSGAFDAFARDLAAIPDNPKGQKARTGSVFGRLAPRRA